MELTTIPSTVLAPKPHPVPNARLDSATTWIPAGPTGGWVEIQIWLLERQLAADEWPGRTGRGTSFVGSLPLASGGTAAVTYLHENARPGATWITNQLVLVHEAATKRSAGSLPTDPTQMWGVAFAAAQEDGSRIFLEFRNPLGEDHSPLPATAPQYTHRGDLFVQAGLLEDAIDAYDRALAIDPDFYGARQNRAVALAALNRIDEALAEFEVLAVSHPDVPNARLNVGTMELLRGNLEAALESFDHFLSTWPRSVEALNNRAAVLKRLGRLEEALESLERACTLKPNGELHFDRAKVLAALGRSEGEEEALWQAISLDPDLGQARLGLGRLLLLKGDHEGALEQYNAASWLGEVDAARLGIAAAMSGLGRRERALEVLDVVLRANAADVQAWSIKAMTLSGLERHQEALEAAEAGLAVEPSNSVLTAVKAVELNELGLHSKAFLVAEQAVRLDIQPLTLRALAATLLDLGRLSEALSTMHQALEIDDSDPGSHFFAACALAELGDVDTSIEHLRGALDRGWGDLEALREESHLRALWANPSALSQMESLMGRAFENPPS